MRATPSQVAMILILGRHIPMMRFESLEKKLRKGREWLVSITGQDFGYDVARWHIHLIKTNAGGYKWSNKHNGFAAMVKLAMANPQWQMAVEALIQQESRPPSPVPEANP